MRVGLVACAYFEPRFIVPFLSHVPNWIEEKLVLVSTSPWQGDPEPHEDTTGLLAEREGAHVVRYNWEAEEDQRNTGQDWFYNFDWVITLDPDEYLTKEGWEALRVFLETAEGRAYVCNVQRTYWKSGFVIDPPEDYKQIIAVKPNLYFVDKRVIGSAWDYAPVELHHMSWRRTDEEVWRKIQHYSHAQEFDKEKWYNQVWKNWHPKMENLHPLTPEALKRAVPADLPKELQDLGL